MNEVKLRQQFDQFLSNVKNLKGTESFYEYESKFVELSQEFAREIVESSLGEVAKDRRKKKSFRQGQERLK